MRVNVESKIWTRVSDSEYNLLARMLYCLPCFEEVENCLHIILLLKKSRWTWREELLPNDNIRSFSSLGDSIPTLTSIHLTIMIQCLPVSYPYTPIKWQRGAKEWGIFFYPICGRILSEHFIVGTCYYSYFPNWKIFHKAIHQMK